MIHNEFTMSADVKRVGAVLGAGEVLLSPLVLCDEIIYCFGVNEVLVITLLLVLLTHVVQR